MNRFFLLTMFCGLTACATSPYSRAWTSSGDKEIQVHRCGDNLLDCGPVSSVLLERPNGCSDLYVEGQWAGVWLDVTSKPEARPEWVPAEGNPKLIYVEPSFLYATKILYCSKRLEPGQHLLTIAACSSERCDPNLGISTQFSVVR